MYCAWLHSTKFHGVHMIFPLNASSMALLHNSAFNENQIRNERTETSVINETRIGTMYYAWSHLLRYLTLSSPLRPYLYGSPKLLRIP